MKNGFYKNKNQKLKQKLQTINFKEGQIVNSL